MGQRERWVEFRFYDSVGFLNDLIECVGRTCAGLADKRRGMNSQFSMRDIGLAGFSPFFMQCPSFCRIIVRFAKGSDTVGRIARLCWEWSVFPATITFEPCKAFQFYGGVCRRGIYDNMKTAVEAIFVGKARRYTMAVFYRCVPTI